ncbi:hypothetical protein BDZ89DRAFT_1062652 [Hymenopellis radicata]|nr:hypothetical protein BDZ89DRAFT_1062652 [Hymenopellis radicata]
MVEHASSLEIPDFSDVVENKHTFLRLSRYLSSNIPESIPKGPSTDTRDTEILVVACLRHLEVAVQDGLHQHVNATDAFMPLISRLMPRMTAWMSYLARNIMVQRDFGRHADVAAPMIFLIDLICTIPQLSSQLCGLPDHSNPTRAFMSETFPLIALHIFSTPTSECQPKYVWAAFNIIEFLHSVKPNNVERRFMQEPFLVVKAFTFTVVGTYEMLMTSTDEREASQAVFMLMLVHEVLGFLDAPAFWEESFRQDHVRWTCVALKALCVCPLLQKEVTVLGKNIHILDATLDCVNTVVMRLSRLLDEGDVVWVGLQILDPDHDVILHLLRFHQVVKLRYLQQNKPLDKDVGNVVWSHILNRITTYLFCYSLVHPARRLLKRLLHDEAVRRDPALVSWQHCVKSFNWLRKVFRIRIPDTLCDNGACPNLNDVKKPKCCAACRLFFYCCTSCQRDSWHHGHRERCAEIRKSLTVAQNAERSAIEIAFLKYTLASWDPRVSRELIRVHVFDFTTNDVPMTKEVSYRIDLFESLDNFAELARRWSAGEGILVCMVLPTFNHGKTERRLYLLPNEDLRRVRYGDSVTYRANDRQLLFPNNDI